jgi:hypothetical protein
MSRTKSTLKTIPCLGYDERRCKSRTTEGGWCGLCAQILVARAMKRVGRVGSDAKEDARIAARLRFKNKDREVKALVDAMARLNIAEREEVAEEVAEAPEQCRDAPQVQQSLAEQLRSHFESLSEPWELVEA